MGSGFLGLTLLSLMGHNGGSVLELSTSRTVLDNSTPTGLVLQNCSDFVFLMETKAPDSSMETEISTYIFSFSEGLANQVV